MKSTIAILLSLFIIVLQISCGQQTDKDVIKIAAAANMQFALEAIADGFEKKHGIKVEVATNSSGMLTSQIKNGAPFDIFISANMRYPKKLHKNGLSNAPIIYAQGKLAMVYSGNYAKGSSWKDILRSDATKKIAIANSKTAPYGIATVELLKQEGLYDELKSKFVYGESIGQVNQYIKSETVDVAFTSNSFVAKFKKSYKSILIEEGYSPIDQGVVILKKGMKNNKKTCELFLKYLASDECKAILVKYGYSVSE
jgi:molybdate transport system substrate-binding protein